MHLTRVITYAIVLYHIQLYRMYFPYVICTHVTYILFMYLTRVVTYAIVLHHK
jgi:hypothetical protein